MSVRLGDKILAGISESDLRRSQVEDGSVVVAKAKDADTVDGHHASAFLRLAGGRMSGNIEFQKADNGLGSVYKNHSEKDDYGTVLNDVDKLGNSASLGVSAESNHAFFSDIEGLKYIILHTDNMSEYVLPLDGSVPMTGNIIMTNFDSYYAMKKGRMVNDVIHYLTVGVSASGETTLEHYTENKLDARLCLIGSAIGDYPILSLMNNLGAKIATVLHTGNMANHVLPLTGGTLSGQLGLYGGYGQCNADENHVNIAAYNTRHDDENHRAFQVLNAAHESDLAYALRVVQVSNGILDKEAIVLTTANKPTGTYIGNGNASQRIIDTGGVGSVVQISGNGYSGIVMSNSAIFMHHNDKTTTVFGPTEVYFDIGVLTEHTAHAALNENGVTYYYQVL